MARKAEFSELGLRPISEISGRKSLGQFVFETLKQAIVLGEISPGKRLVESRIADLLDISRTPVREAIHKLEREGFVARRPRGGFVVRGLEREDIEETFGIRAVLESYAARLAALNHRPEELRTLENKIDEYQLCMDRGQMDELPRINTEFHDVLYALSRSPRLIKMINDLKDQIFRFRQIILKRERFARTSNQDHRQMLTYIRRRDADMVEQLVRAHMRRGLEAVLEEYDVCEF